MPAMPWHIARYCPLLTINALEADAQICTVADWRPSNGLDAQKPRRLSSKGATTTFRAAFLCATL